MSDICRLCGDLKPLEGLSCLKDNIVAYQLENNLNISLEGDKMLPNSVCDLCCQNVSFCCEFIMQVNTVQLRLKADLAEQLQMIVFDPFVADGETKEADMKTEKAYPDSDHFVDFQPPGGSKSFVRTADKAARSSQNICLMSRKVPAKKDNKSMSRTVMNRQRGKFEVVKVSSIFNLHLF